MEELLMAHNLIKKYGILPKSNMKETYQSSSTNTMNVLINQRLRHAARDLFKNKRNRTEKFVKNVLMDIYTILVIFLGEPPTKFNWEYYSKLSNSKDNLDDGSGKGKEKEKRRLRYIKYGKFS